MSVFSDFQRMWVQRFPYSALSDAWEQDVRASLHRHKQKIADLTKEIEQEKLYVGYLERLLSDVEQFRESGGDPSALFDAASPSVAGKTTAAAAPATTTAEDCDGGAAPAAAAAAAADDVGKEVCLFLFTKLFPYLYNYNIDIEFTNIN